MNQDFASKLDPLDTQPQGPDLMFYWQLLKSSVKKYYIGIAALSILATVLAAMFVQTLQPTYVASTRLHVKPRGENVFNLSEVFFEWRDPAFQETQIAIITSRDVLVNAVETLGLHKPSSSTTTKKSTSNQSSFFSDTKGWFGNLLGTPKPVTNTEQQYTDQERKDIKAAEIRGLITIQPVGESYLLQLSVSDSDPRRAADIANAVSDSYVQSIYDSDVQASLNSQTWLMDRMSSLREDLRVAEQALQNFREQEDILGSSKAQGSQSDLDLISSALLTVRENRMSLENQNNQIRQIQLSGSNKYTNIPVVANHPLVQTITQEVF